MQNLYKWIFMFKINIQQYILINKNIANNNELMGKEPKNASK